MKNMGKIIDKIEIPKKISDHPMIILQMEIPIPMKEKYQTISILDNNIIKWNLEQIHKITQDSQEIEFKDPQKTKTKTHLRLLIQQKIRTVQREKRTDSQTGFNQNKNR